MSYGSEPRSCSGTPIHPCGNANSASPVVRAGARRTRTSPQVAFRPRGLGLRSAGVLLRAGCHVLLGRSFMQRAVQPPHEDELLCKHVVLRCKQVYTGIQHAVLCRNRHANAEPDSLRIGTSLLHDTIDTRRATAPALSRIMRIDSARSSKTSLMPVSLLPKGASF